MITGIRTHIFIGGKEILRAPRVWIESARHAPLSLAGITLPDPEGELHRSISQGDQVEIRLGYINETPAIWKGTVTWTRPGTEDQLEAGAVGEEKPLADTRITMSWQEETPEAIVRLAVNQSGLSTGQIDSPGVTFPRFVAGNIPVWQVARQCAHTCQRSFSLDMSKWALWRGADGKVNWGDFDEPGDMPAIKTAAGLIKHIPASDAKAASLVETFLIAGFMHSMKFRLVDVRRGVDDQFRALRVRHEVTDKSARTFIWYGEEYEKF
jgi:hypothetical protein